MWGESLAHWCVFTVFFWRSSSSSRRREEIDWVDFDKNLRHRRMDLWLAGIKRRRATGFCYTSIVLQNPPSDSNQDQRSGSAGRSCRGRSQNFTCVMLEIAAHWPQAHVIYMKSAMLIQRKKNCLNKPRESRISHNPGCAGWGETRPWMQTHSGVSARLLVRRLLKFRVQAFCA